MYFVHQSDNYTFYLQMKLKQLYGIASIITLCKYMPVFINNIIFTLFKYFQRFY